MYTSVGLLMDCVSPKDGKTKLGAAIYELSLTNIPGDINLDSVRPFSRREKDAQDGQGFNSMTDKNNEATSIQLEKLQNDNLNLVTKNVDLENKNKQLLDKISQMETDKANAERKLN